MENEKLYLLVYVSYDYDRFQRNVMASLDINDCLNLVMKGDVPVFRYDCESEKYHSLENELLPDPHYWIQEFNIKI